MLTLTRIHIAIVFHFSTDYFPAFEVALRAYAEFHPWETVFHIVTNTADTDEQNEIRVVCAKHLPETAKITIHAFPDLDNPFFLPWMHKPILEEWFLKDTNADLFIYAEHDIVITRKTIEHYLSAREHLRPDGLLPGFVRFERTESDGVNIVDFWSAWKLCAKSFKILGGKYYALDYKPYCAFYILDRELAEEHIRSPAFKEKDSREVSTWEIRERAAIGALHSQVPDGRMHRYALLLDDAYQPCEATWVWHATNNYSSNPETPHGKVAMLKCIAPTVFTRIKARLHGCV